jgi:histidinol-phosphate/aromatic aminotransferase/cobyric acid decarboxylase-like protein
MEGMQGTIYFLQQQLKTSKETLATLQQENAALKKTLSQHQVIPTTISDWNFLLMINLRRI